MPWRLLSTLYYQWTNLSIFVRLHNQGPSNLYRNIRQAQSIAYFDLVVMYAYKPYPKNM